MRATASLFMPKIGMHKHDAVLDDVDPLTRSAHQGEELSQRARDRRAGASDVQS